MEETAGWSNGGAGKRAADAEGTADLTRETIESIDSARQIDDILAMPDHLRDALWRVESATLEPTTRRAA